MSFSAETVLVSPNSNASSSPFHDTTPPSATVKEVPHLPLPPLSTHTDFESERHHRNVTASPLHGRRSLLGSRRHYRTYPPRGVLYPHTTCLARGPTRAKTSCPRPVPTRTHPPLASGRRPRSHHLQLVSLMLHGLSPRGSVVPGVGCVLRGGVGVLVSCCVGGDQD